MNSSFYNGISGIKSSQFGIDVWADNISNISTTGFIGKTPEFSSQFSNALNEYNNTTANQIGLGTQAQAASLDTFKQGIFSPTDRAFDMALDGQGFFGVQGKNGNIYYTRAGAFSIDANGDLVDESGNYLQGTLGGNISPTTLSQSKLEEFGNYYDTTSNTQTLGTPYSVNILGDVALGDVSNQSTINLPDILYLPPEPTTYVNYQANLDPKITTQTNYIKSSDIDNLSLINTYPTGSISGSLTNNTNIDNLKSGDTITLTLLDESSNSTQVTTTLDSNLNFSLSNVDISSIDNNNIHIADEIQLVQEVPNVEHFTTEVISPSGEKNIVDMTFTKQVPQQPTQTVWDAEIKLLNYVEDYKTLNYDPNTTYDPAVYNVDTTTQKVTKIYNPSLYYIDTAADKVYKIVDSQTGSATFGSDGELKQSNIPTLSNDGVALDINIGTPYQAQTLSDGTLDIIHNGFDGIISSINSDKSRYSDDNGYVEGILNKYSMDSNGNIIAEFNNGRTSALAKVAIYQFRNPQGLTNVTSTLFNASANSGDPLFFTNDDGTYRGTFIRSGNLEGTNVDYGTALTELLIMQKAFDASAKSITTSDQLLQNAINMKK